METFLNISSVHNTYSLICIHNNMANIASDEELLENLLKDDDTSGKMENGEAPTIIVQPPPNVYNANLSDRDLRKLLDMYSTKPKPVYSSIYQVFFKLKYYIAFNIPPNNPWLLLFGNSKDHVDQRFLLFFYDYESFFTVTLAVLVMFAHISFLCSIIKEVSKNCIANSTADLYFAVLLCTFYAANVATDSFMSYLPFEVFGLTRQELVQYWEDKIELAGGDRPSESRGSTASSLANSMLLQRMGRDIPISRLTDANFKHLSLQGKIGVNVEIFKSSVSTGFIWGVIGTILLSNIALLVSVGIILGTNDTYVGVVQNFIAVEIVTYVHELVPKALQIFDVDPDYCSQSWFQVVQEMEQNGDLPSGVLVKADKGKSAGLFRQPARIWYQRLYIFYFLFVWAIYFATQYLCGNLGNDSNVDRMRS